MYYIDVVYYIDVIFYIAVVILAFKYQEKFDEPVLKLLPYFFLIDLSLSLITIIITKLFNSYNVWLINLIFAFELSFYFYFYYQLLKNKKYKKFTLIAGVIFAIYFITTFALSENKNFYMEKPFFTGTIFAIIIMMLYILDMLASDDFLYIHKHLIFWVTVAFLLYLVIPFPLSFWMSLFNKYGSESIGKAYLYIQTFANSMMYLTLIFGILWSKKRSRLYS